MKKRILERGPNMKRLRFLNFKREEGVQIDQLGCGKIREGSSEIGLINVSTTQKENGEEF